ncbi:hypothetical protein ACSNOB_25105 [Micromonospora sp. URMC 106]|uniref:hypothetical protein n=1 Tax=Micromonospora sp. URMC 106 TaxID=3423408 RepID=UPI003F1D61EF
MLVRDAMAADRFDLFVVSAVVAVLATRVFLKMTGFPQLGGGGLHVAHVLWGGLGMLAGQLLSMLFLGPAAKNAAAVLSGVGFGLFIDEVGKFVTADNNYFYEPVAAIVHGTFVVVYVLVRLGVVRRPLSQRERLANSVEQVADDLARAADRAEYERALHRLRLLGDAGASVAVGPPNARPAPTSPRSTPHRLRVLCRSAWSRFCRRPFVHRAAAPAVVLFTLISLGRPLVLLSRNATVSNAVYAAFASASFALAVIGLWRWNRGRLASALGLFEVALMVQVLVVQVFWLLDSEFAGVPLVTCNLLLLALCRTLTREGSAIGTASHRHLLTC